MGWCIWYFHHKNMRICIYVVGKNFIQSSPFCALCGKSTQLDKSLPMPLLALLTNINCAVLTGAVGSNSSQHSMIANSTLLPGRLKRSLSTRFSAWLNIQKSKLVLTWINEGSIFAKTFGIEQNPR